MKETEKVPYDSMPQLIKGLFLTKEQVEKLKEPFKDAVQVVRCKDCRYHDAGENEVDAWDRCRLHRIETDDDEFCSWGVKKNG